MGRKEEHLTYGGRYFAVGNGHTAAFVVSFTTTVMLWRVYTYRCGEAMPAALAAVENQLTPYAASVTPTGCHRHPPRRDRRQARSIANM